ncbi:ABC transporter permease [Nocardia sp. NBC_00565]|uniref:ABC transporter permease n=1 Tax=Nocardia sp. NBC_00565 TaxID=2975993 RepID=UPI002E81579E|nr:ABC transporter permease [Nocardia sp. NBC_00565]WUC00894.1 ABC transporter permease [Nocardia sp. NBC_00565]
MPETEIDTAAKLSFDREPALLRTIGTTPRQVRGMAIAIAVPAMIVGVLPGIGLDAFLPRTNARRGCRAGTDRPRDHGRASVASQTSRLVHRELLIFANVEVAVRRPRRTSPVPPRTIATQHIPPARHSDLMYSGQAALPLSDDL